MPTQILIIKKEIKFNADGCKTPLLILKMPTAHKQNLISISFTLSSFSSPISSCFPLPWPPPVSFSLSKPSLNYLSLFSKTIFPSQTHLSHPNLKLCFLKNKCLYIRLFGTLFSTEERGFFFW
jgi:hypothetical protein